MANSEVVQAAIDAGHVLAVESEVSISDKASPTGKGAKKSYTQLIAQNAQGMAALCNGKIVPATAKPEEGADTRTEEQKAAGACDFFNYGFDLDVRAGIRQELMGTLEGPEKQIKKLFDALVAAGHTKDEAAQFVLDSPKFKGVDGVPNLVARAKAA